MAEAPDIYRYLDFRTFLRDWCAHRKVVDRQFSARKFARLAGKTSPGLLTEVVDGDRALTPAMVAAFARATGLSRAEADFFDALVQLDQAPDRRGRNHAWERISAVRAFQEARRADGAAFQLLSCWWFPVVRELARRADFQADPAWIAKRVRPSITEGQARRALDTLVELGLLAEREGRLRPTDVVVAAPAEVAGLAAHNHHRGLLERALEAIDRLPAEERHFLSATVSVPARIVPELERELDRARARILELCARHGGDAQQVVQVQLLLFPLSDRADAPSDGAPDRD